MGGDGVRAERAQRRARAHPAGGDERARRPRPGTPLPVVFPRRGGAAGGLQIPVQPDTFTIHPLFTENHRAMRDYADTELTVLH